LGKLGRLKGCSFEESIALYPRGATDEFTPLGARLTGEAISEANPQLTLDILSNASSTNVADIETVSVIFSCRTSSTTFFSYSYDIDKDDLIYDGEGEVTINLDKEDGNIYGVLRDLKNYPVKISLKVTTATSTSTYDTTYTIANNIKFTFTD
jgi:hypothetical protein